MIENITTNCLLYHRLSIGAIAFKLYETTCYEIIKLWINYSFNKNINEVYLLTNHDLKKFKSLKSNYNKHKKQNTLNILN